MPLSSVFSVTHTHRHTHIWTETIHWREETRQKNEEIQENLSLLCFLSDASSPIFLFSLSVSFSTPQLFCNFLVCLLCFCQPALCFQLSFMEHMISCLAFRLWPLFLHLSLWAHFDICGTATCFKPHISAANLKKLHKKNNNKEVSHLLLRKGWTGSWCSNLLDWSSTFA